MRATSSPATRALCAFAALFVVLLSRPAGAGGASDDPYAKQLQAKVATVVAVKAVLKASGGGGDREFNVETIGVVVDPSGVVMMQNWFGGQRGSGKVTPVSIRILFDGDEKEYDAILGAMDSKLGLAFVKVKDLAGKKIASVDFSDGAETSLGDEVFGVYRMEEGFDYAPYYFTGKLVGQVTKPRTMWFCTAASAQYVGHPMYTPEGKVAGVVIRQSGNSEESRISRVFLLPVKSVVGVVGQAIKASAKALEDSKAQEADAGMGEPAAMGDAGGMETPPPGMGQEPAPGMGDTPPGMEGGK